MARASTAADTKKKATAKKQLGAKKASGYNHFMKKEMARLKEAEPDLAHKERFKRAAQSWHASKENPKNKK